MGKRWGWGILVCRVKVDAEVLAGGLRGTGSVTVNERKLRRREEIPLKDRLGY